MAAALHGAEDAAATAYTRKKSWLAFYENTLFQYT